MSVSTDDCIEWDSHLNNAGYGSRWHEGRTRSVHKVAYEEVHGPVPPGLQIDHLCANRACFNVDHLEVVTPRENRLRGRNANSEKTHCKQGHLLVGENVYHPTRGGRQCRACAKASEDRRTERRRARNLLESNNGG